MSAEVGREVGGENYPSIIITEGFVARVGWGWSGDWRSGAGVGPGVRGGGAGGLLRVGGIRPSGLVYHHVAALGRVGHVIAGPGRSALVLLVFLTGRLGASGPSSCRLCWRPSGF